MVVGLRLRLGCLVVMLCGKQFGLHGDETQSYCIRQNCKKSYRLCVI